MKNIPATWCLEPFAHEENPGSLNGLGERMTLVACLEGPGNVQITNADGKIVTLTEENPCCLLNVSPSSNLSWNLFSSPGLQSIQFYKRVR